ncbi:hypothetical protein BCR37DRAFT_388148 [Protomyces lactucae-debilis]|uniref:Uncharacterized protein n=1 Tax=Protomyces lactucae-debilis TaxID=2754530 RepID=A0A1Y2F941_PROLT|nr:uncharacterized protein BCR37DRAFT_388148 [Protomyces lactucae-debilis]ORY80430.1 hypothetical protein BCR37DRAFT_388148 [Protomyces lactucae-debilis]
MSKVREQATLAIAVLLSTLICLPSVLGNPEAPLYDQACWLQLSEDTSPNACIFRPVCLPKYTVKFEDLALPTFDGVYTKDAIPSKDPASYPKCYGVRRDDFPNCPADWFTTDLFAETPRFGQFSRQPQVKEYNYAIVCENADGKDVDTHNSYPGPSRGPDGFGYCRFEVERSANTLAKFSGYCYDAAPSSRPNEL